MDEPKPILVLDDDPDLRTMVRRILEKDGFRVVTAEDGPSALALCDTALPGGIVADLMLPVMDGEAFLQELRRRHPDHQVPVILVTASAIRREVAARAKVNASVEKPFDPEDLREVVRACCGEHRRSIPPAG